MTGFRRRLLGGAVAAVAALTILPASIAAAEGGPPEDGLGQVIDPDQAQGTGRMVLDDGHIDFGPTLNTGEWIVQIHDDTASPSYWRMPSDVVAQVNDSSKLTIPDDDAYAFLGLEPGSEAWVIPQVREPGVIWAGWNTQEPNVLDSLSMGTTLRILGVDGPGEVSVYLQSGNFGEPDPLWSTLDPFPQESWIEVNTHTHANWVFSEPGVYLVELEFSGELVDGTTVSARDALRFAVGDETDPEAAFEAEFDEAALAEAPDAETAAGDGAEAAAGNAATGTEATGLILGIVAGVVGAALVVALVVLLIAARRARTRARAAARQRVAERRGASDRTGAGARDEGGEGSGDEGGAA
ncbi:TIGR03773 family transporter-associated surface protein [Leucobacter sp.]